MYLWASKMWQDTVLAEQNKSWKIFAGKDFGFSSIPVFHSLSPKKKSKILERLLKVTSPLPFFSTKLFPNSKTQQFFLLKSGHHQLHRDGRRPRVLFLWSRARPHVFHAKRVFILFYFMLLHNNSFTIPLDRCCRLSSATQDWKVLWQELRMKRIFLKIMSLVSFSFSRPNPISSGGGRGLHRNEIMDKKEEGAEKWKKNGLDGQWQRREAKGKHQMSMSIELSWWIKNI